MSDETWNLVTDPVRKGGCRPISKTVLIRKKKKSVARSIRGARLHRKHLLRLHWLSSERVITCEGSHEPERIHFSRTLDHEDTAAVRSAFCWRGGPRSEWRRRFRLSEPKMLFDSRRAAAT